MIRSLLIALIAMLFVAPSVNATTYLFTYTGDAGYEDRTGEIGPAGVKGSAPFTAVYVLNLPTLGTTVYDDGSYGFVARAPGSASPFSATLTILGQTFSVSGNSYAEATRNYAQDTTASWINNRIGEYYSDGEFDTYKWLDNGIWAYYLLKTSNVLAPLHWTTADFGNQPTDGFCTCFGQFYYETYNQSGSLHPHDFYAYFDNYSVSVSSVDSVPESDTWIMMLAGFSLVGFTLRIRRITAHRL